MRNKIPPDAFEYYRSLGPGRTYAAVATHFGVSLRGVTKRATRENWQERLTHIESAARRKADDKAIDDLQAIDERHLRVTRAIQARALEALKVMPLTSGMAAVRALDVAVKLERSILGRERGSEDLGKLEDLLIEARRRREEAAPAASPVAAPPPPASSPTRVLVPDSWPPAEN